MLAGKEVGGLIDKPYSLDLRARVVAAVVRDRLSRRQAAVGVAISPIAGLSKSAGAGASCPARLLARINEQDFTLRELVGELAKRGLKVNYRPV